MFSEVLQAGLVTSVNVDTNQSDKLLRLLDTVVIKLEGGTEEDLKVLDEKPNIEHKPMELKESVPAANAITTSATNDVKSNANENAASADAARSEGEEEDDDENKR